MEQDLDNDEINGSSASREKQYPILEAFCLLMWCLIATALAIWLLYMGQRSPHVAPYQMLSPVVATASGSAQGIIVPVDGSSSGIFAFYAVPYAEAPLLSARFRKPKAVHYWEATLEATMKAAPCVQQHLSRRPRDNVTDFTEDCLHLNVWTPNLNPGRPQPVVVVLHAGGFAHGSNRMEEYDGAACANRTGAVVVVPNYRLGVLGFLHGNTSVLPGNQGLWDQRMALFWVRDNVAFFGGDPNQVVLWGVEAGAISAGLHLMSPLSRPLFSHAILQGGSPLSPIANALDPGNVQAVARAVCGGIADSNETLTCLQRALPSQLMDIPVEDDIRRTLNPFLPTYGDELVPKLPFSVLSEGPLHHQTRVLLGFTDKEGVDLFRRLLEEVREGDGESWDKVPSQTYRSSVVALFTFLFGVDVMKIENLHPDAATPSDAMGSFRFYADAVSSALFKCPIVALAALVAEGGAAYVYEYERYAPSAEVRGALPNSDFLRAFGTSKVASPTAYQGEDFIAAVTRFILTGTVDWPAYTGTNPIVKHFRHNGSITRTSDLTKRCQAYFKYYNKQRK